MAKYTILLIIVYLVRVINRDNERELLALLSHETGFIKWFIAIVIVGIIADKLPGGGVLYALVFTAMLLTAVEKNPNVFNELSNFLRV